MEQNYQPNAADTQVQTKISAPTEQIVKTAEAAVPNPKATEEWSMFPKTKVESKSPTLEKPTISSTQTRIEALGSNLIAAIGSLSQSENYWKLPLTSKLDLENVGKFLKAQLDRVKLGDTSNLKSLNENLDVAEKIVSELGELSLDNEDSAKLRLGDLDRRAKNWLLY